MSDVKLQSIRGMNDVLAAETPYWNYLENLLRGLALRYGYREIRFPLLESIELFKRTIGAATDIVEKEMFAFEDRNGDVLALRPEGTAGCVRALIEHSALQQQPVQRLWYAGQMFRHERPQKGRYRQFNQFGIEAFGMAGPEIEAEHMCMVYRLWQQLGLSEQVELQINSLGTAESRRAYREVLVGYLQQHFEQLDEDSQRRLTTNPLRVLDSKNPALQEIIAHAPKLQDHLDEQAQQHFTDLQKLLTQAQIPFRINPSLVRGLDYYGFTVYEWVTTALGAQGTICAGGRYNGLVEQLGGPSSPAVGFAIGLERVVLLLQQQEKIDLHNPDIYMVLMGVAASAEGLKLAELLRTQCPNLRIEMNAAGGNFKAQFRRADRSGARWAIILGDDEVAQQCATVKDLREESPQQKLNYAECVEFFASIKW